MPQKKRPAATPSDEEVAAAVQNGQTDQFEIIVERYEKRLQHYTRSLVYDQDHAADVVQNTFLKAYVNLNSFNTERKLSSWLYRIAHNEAVNFIKKHSRELHPDDEAWFDRIPDEATPTAEHIDQDILKQKMAHVISSLPLKYRDPLVLFYFETKSYQEISDILRLPVATVGTRINRAKGMLKQQLAKEGIDYE